MSKDNSEGKKFLDDLLKYTADIEELQAELAYWRESTGAASVAPVDEMIRERTGELEKAICNLRQKKLEATRMIDEMGDPVGRAILRRRYILGDPWVKIAGECGNMSQRNAHYIHDEAMKQFDEIYREKCSHNENGRTVA